MKEFETKSGGFHERFPFPLPLPPLTKGRVGVCLQDPSHGISQCHVKAIVALGEQASEAGFARVGRTNQGYTHWHCGRWRGLGQKLVWSLHKLCARLWRRGEVNKIA